MLASPSANERTYRSYYQEIPSPPLPNRIKQQDAAVLGRILFQYYCVLSFIRRYHLRCPDGQWYTVPSGCYPVPPPSSCAAFLLPLPIYAEVQKCRFCDRHFCTSAFLITYFSCYLRSFSKSLPLHTLHRTMSVTFSNPIQLLTFYPEVSPTERGNRLLPEGGR